MLTNCTEALSIELVPHALVALFGARNLKGPTIHSTCFTKPNPHLLLSLSLSKIRRKQTFKKKKKQKKETALQLHLFAMHAPEEEEEEAKPEREPRSEANTSQHHALLENKP